MDIAYTAEEISFLAAVRAFLIDYAARNSGSHSRQDFYRELGERNWLALS